VRILLATDAFPPVCGGSGWSTYELAKGLRARGHAVSIVRPRFGTGATGMRQGEEYDGFRPAEWHDWAPPVPFVRNYFKNERHYRRFKGVLSQLVAEHAIDVLHGQHLLSGPPAIDAARAAGIPAVCTVRDYWPVCYWSDLIHDASAATTCPGCSAAMMTNCVRPHAGAGWPLALPAIPYMRANLAGKRQALARADAVIAVSASVADDLRRRAGELHATRIECIPNPIDAAGIRRQAAAGDRPTPGPYALFVGKLEANKGAGKLIAALRRSRLDWPVVIVGDGSERPHLEAAFRAERRDVRFLGWRPRVEVLRWMRHSSILVFTSHWPEPLSRVLLEASTLGVPVAAMDTGGTREIVVHGQTGLLSRSADALGDDVARLRADERLRRELGQNAERRVDDVFDARIVVARIEALYLDLLGSTPRTGA
jgi:glycosyltransferase involved in cell wall biosynthesis